MGQWWEYVITLWLAQFYIPEIQGKKWKISENGKVAKGHRTGGVLKINFIFA